VDQSKPRRNGQRSCHRQRPDRKSAPVADANSNAICNTYSSTSMSRADCQGCYNRDLTSQRTGRDD